MEASDSPSVPRILDASDPTTCRTPSLFGTSACSRAIDSSVSQFVAWSDTTYKRPRLAMDPSSIAFTPCRRQISSATGCVRWSSVERPMSRNVSRSRSSGTMLRYGDWLSFAASP